ncbi:methyltransferase type 11 [Aestuariibacter halophilus]|uniref:Methyltransferase type 11 n=1 Tax=Fluctibacter halophilus TaxID=226011 RepID=A0ABS8GA00_9ALTE|nr:methyltransferase type 11 [Aestuariibacter halophilus]MCC2617417.1 methyltransferase type 11 [Aestuariibacter halophilus]
MFRSAPSIIALAALMTFSSPEVIADPLTKLLDSPERSEADRTADARRKPASFMAFLDVQKDMQVLDVFSGGGYYSEIAAAVVGPGGQVIAHNNQAYVDYIGQDKLSARYADGRLPNVKQLIQEANELSLPQQQYDRILLVLSFHDLFYADPDNGWPAIDAPAFMKTLRSSLKPGGLIGIIDHVAAPGTNTSVAQTFHRISPDIIIEKMQQWGFGLHKQADYLRNPDDPLTVPMWDESIRGKTDRVVMAFTAL